MAATTEPAPSVTSFTTLSFSPHAQDPDAPDWDELMTHDASGIWLVERPQHDPLESARGWSIAVVTRGQRVLLVHPKLQSVDDANITAVVRPIGTKADAATNGDFLLMIQGSTSHYGRAAVPGTKVADVFHMLHKAGIANYRLENGRGLRYWIALALFVLRPVIKEPNAFDWLPDLSLRYLRRPYVLDAAGNKTGLQKGQTLPHKLDRLGWTSVVACWQKNDDVATWADM